MMSRRQPSWLYSGEEKSEAVNVRRGPANYANDNTVDRAGGLKVKYALTPISEPFPPDVAAILAGYPQRNGYVLQLFRVFANSLRFLKKGTTNLLDRDSPIPMRQREIVILRVCANNDCECYRYDTNL